MFYDEITTKTRPFLHINLLILYSVQQQIHFNGNVFGNKWCRYNEDSLYKDIFIKNCDGRRNTVMDIDEGSTMYSLRLIYKHCRGHRNIAVDIDEGSTTNRKSEQMKTTSRALVNPTTTDV